MHGRCKAVSTELQSTLAGWVFRRDTNQVRVVQLVTSRTILPSECPSTHSSTQDADIKDQSPSSENTIHHPFSENPLSSYQRTNPITNSQLYPSQTFVTMKTAVISTLLALAALGSAAPGSPAPPAPTASLSAGYYNYVTVTLQGAGSGESYYYYYLPTDGTSIQLCTFTSFSCTI